ATGTLRLPDLESSLPCDVYLWPNARSYTGQPVVEIHTIGSPPLLQLVLRSLTAAGARLAGPGEFTLRAFLAGRIDLTQAEAVLGVIDAADPRELDVALGQLAGGLAEPLHRLRDALVDLLAELEAGLDFADEDLSFITPEQLDRQLGEATRQVAQLTQQVDSRGEAADRIRAVLVGRPNSGKSSLFNALVRDAGALVSSHPGTTRDYLTAELDLDGIKCQLIDTAGVEFDEQPMGGDNAQDDVRRDAQAAAAEQNRRANIRILCLDSSGPPDEWQQTESLDSPQREQLVVHTKVDLADRTDLWPDRLHTSSLTGEGIEALRDALRQAGTTPSAVGITNQRETIVAWDRHTGQPLHRALVWQDRRTAQRCRELEEELGA
ncbi:hypothetical protein LCGC14_2940380, partial [marine sediment metagenome]